MNHIDIDDVRTVQDDCSIVEDVIVDNEDNECDSIVTDANNVAMTTSMVTTKTSPTTKTMII